MAETPVSCRLRCLIEGEPIIFLVSVEHDCRISKLKKVIRSELAPLCILKDIGPHTLDLLKVNIDLNTHDVGSLSHLRFEENSQDVEMLESWESIGEHWPDQHSIAYKLHIIVKIPPPRINETINPREAGFARVASRNPFRIIGPPINMAKLILLRHNIQGYNRKHTGSFRVRQPKRPCDISTTRPKLRSEKSFNRIQFH